MPLFPLVAFVAQLSFGDQTWERNRLLSLLDDVQDVRLDSVEIFVRLGMQFTVNFVDGLCVAR
jgi:hypothetical protein